MPKRIALTTLNASTIDILNVIRQNAPYDYQQNVPEVETEKDIPAVGEVIYGTPAFANHFINSLVNRIAMVRVTSATFNNPYSILKKGYIEYGESIEEIFVGIAKVIDFNVEKAPKREFQRNIPDVKSAFHAINWRVMYPITIEDEQLRTAFLNADGVTNLIANIVDQVYTAAEYDEFLLFKYLLIKAISKGKFAPELIGDGTNLNDAAVQFRGISNMLPFMKTYYNEAGVKTSTPKERQVIFMDAIFNAKFDVEVLAGAFNMEKADFMGRLFLIDDWTTFDNERFAEIRATSTGLEEVTEDELALMKNVKAIICDENWFQVYDNLNKMTEVYVSTGLYWNYNYHVWKTISNSPFSNAVVFATTDATITVPENFTVKIGDKGDSAEATVFTLIPQVEGATLEPNNVNFIQTDALTKAGIGVHPYGGLLIPHDQFATEITLEANINGTLYKASTTINASSDVDATVEMQKQA